MGEKHSFTTRLQVAIAAKGISVNPTSQKGLKTNVSSFFFVLIFTFNFNYDVTGILFGNN